MIDRMDRINSQVQEIVSRFFNEHRDLFLPVILTITQVMVTRDLQHCQVWVGAVGAMNETELKKKLENLRRDLQSEIGDKVTFKFTPIVEFIIDHSGEKAQHIEELLKEK
ncbi:MAG: ribosome-binding factor A [Patescibacteria group bacterium]|nr:ribosome-binding factor A [Patescibacteria group bacterium]